MSTAVKSDGENQRLFGVFLVEFDGASDDRINKAMEWFSMLKENGRPRIDDVTLPFLCEAIAKFYDRYKNAPAILKKYNFIKLQQGKKSWEKELNCKNSDNKDCSDKLPWE